VRRRREVANTALDTPGVHSVSPLPETRKALHKFLSQASVKDRLWIPQQVAREYHRHLYEVRFEPVAALRRLTRQLEDARELRAAEHRARIGKLLKNVEKVLREAQAKYKSAEELAWVEKIADHLRWEGRQSLGRRPTCCAFRGGEERYNKNVPPGFADSGKKGDDRFGGLVVCKQVIEFAKGKFIPVPRRASLFGMIDDLTTTNRPAGCPFGEADAAVARNARPVRRDAGPPENRSIIRRMGRANPKRLRRRACRSGPLAIRKSRPPGLPVGSPRGGRLGRAKLAAKGIAGQPRTEVAGHGPRREVHLLLDTADFVTGIAHAL